MGKYVVTPWKVEGKVEYDRLIKEFGTEPLTETLIQRIEEKAGKKDLQIRRGLVFSHRELKEILDRNDKGEGFYLYTGRGPSGQTHIGHLVPYMLTKYLQDAFKVKLYFMLTNDEKFLFQPALSLEDTTNYAYENALDFIAVGFSPKDTKIIVDTEDIKEMYDIALKVAKKVTFNTAKATFGFNNSTNIGLAFWPAVQSAPAFLESKYQGKKVSCLIPCAIDQDPYWRITRDVAEKLGYYKPGAIHTKFLPGLGEGGKMSASDPKTAIFTNDSAEEVKEKVMNSFTGGRPTLAEQKKEGGRPDMCPVYMYYLYLFEEDDGKLLERYNACRNGSLMCGDCKKELVPRVTSFLEKHQKAKKEAKKVLDKFLLKSK